MIANSAFKGDSIAYSSSGKNSRREEDDAESVPTSEEDALARTFERLGGECRTFSSVVAGNVIWAVTSTGNVIGNTVGDTVHLIMYSIGSAIAFTHGTITAGAGNVRNGLYLPDFGYRYKMIVRTCNSSVAGILRYVRMYFICVCVFHC